MSILFGVYRKGKSNFFFFSLVSFVSSDTEYESERKREMEIKGGKKLLENEPKFKATSIKFIFLFHLYIYIYFLNHMQNICHLFLVIVT